MFLTTKENEHVQHVFCCVLCHQEFLKIISDFAGQETKSNADVYYACNSPRYIFLSLPQDITGIEKRVLLKLANLGVNLSNSMSSLLITFLENMTQVHVSI